MPDTSALKGVGNTEPLWYYILKFPNIIIIPYVLPFFFYGLYISVKGRDRKQILLLTWLLIFLIGISLTREKVLRYGLFILPSSLLITGLGLEEFLRKFFKTPSKIETAKLFSILCILLFCWQLYPRTIMLLDMGIKYHYIGFKEAGQWIAGNNSKDAIIMAGSERAIRYYSGINYKEFGGAIINIPENKTEFEEIVLRSKQPIILVVDRWEATQPEWIHPLSEIKIRYLENLGVHFRKEIKGETFISKYQKEIVPVVWIFEH